MSTRIYKKTVRFDGKCCSNSCQCDSIVHKNHFASSNISATIYNCEHCFQKICSVCMPAHIDRHLMTKIKNLEIKILESKIQLKKNELEHLKKI
jgi:hypothetical protein